MPSLCQLVIIRAGHRPLQPLTPQRHHPRIVPSVQHRHAHRPVRDARVHLIQHVVEPELRFRRPHHGAEGVEGVVVVRRRYDVSHQRIVECLLLPVHQPQQPADVLHGPEGVPVRLEGRADPPRRRQRASPRRQFTEQRSVVFVVWIERPERSGVEKEEASHEIWPRRREVYGEVPAQGVTRDVRRGADDGIHEVLDLVSPRIGAVLKARGGARVCGSRAVGP
mmetsp:Transcript_8868/g.24795  ORF Transcript_8868/g.24795 Transcript_8868/m.24795 type:complete len:223 (+) Transcript_8868:203-871(+)